MYAYRDFKTIQDEQIDTMFIDNSKRDIMI